MQIHLSASDFNFERSNSPQTVTDRWLMFGHHPGVRNHHDVAFQRIAIVSEKFSQVLTPDFFLTLNHEVDVYREVAVLLQRFLNSNDVRENLSFVVSGPTRKHITV